MRRAGARPTHPLGVRRTLDPGPPSAASKARARPRDWRWQLRHCVTSAEALATALPLTPREIEGARRAAATGLKIAITPYYLSLIDRTDIACPIRLQCVPDAREEETVDGDLVDPLGEVAHEVAPYLIQSYPDRALLLATDRCAVHCRFCTRSRMVGNHPGARSHDAFGAAFAYLEAHPEVRDVIISGGDPLTMTTDRLVSLVERLRAISSLATLRLATRAPVTLPMRITRELTRALRKFHPLWVMTHFNHPKELTRESEAACRRFVDDGFPVLNQTVLLRGINDDVATLERLFRHLVRVRVRPYYLLQADPVRGTAHLRTSMATGLSIMGQLQGRLTGIALPTLVCDTPGGKGKVPLVPNYVVERADGRTVLRTFRGEEVECVDPPASD